MAPPRQDGRPGPCGGWSNWTWSRRSVRAENRIPIPAQPGQSERVSYERERRGTANLCLTCEPWVGQRHVAVTEQRTAVDFAQEVRNLLEVRYPHAEKVILVMDNLNPINSLPCPYWAWARSDTPG